MAGTGVPLTAKGTGLEDLTAGQGGRKASTFAQGLGQRAQFPVVQRYEYNWGMLKRFVLLLCLAVPIAALVPVAMSQSTQDAEKAPKRGRKYTPPPDTARISVKVIKETTGKPIEHAAVIFHILQGTEKNKGNMELKTNDEGDALIDVIPIGVTVRLQIIANGFQTFGDDYKVDSDTKEIIVKMKRPVRQYSTYEHPETQAQTESKPPPK